MATYTAALISNTAVPAWHEAHREMPFIFAGSAATAAAGVALIGAPPDQAGPARTAGRASGPAIELAAAELLLKRLGMVGEPYREGRPGAFMRTARALTIAGVGVAAARSSVAPAVGAGRSRRSRRHRC